MKKGAITIYSVGAPKVNVSLRAWLFALVSHPSKVAPAAVKQSASVSRGQFGRFLLVGGTCFTLNLGVLYVGTSLFHLHYLLSMMISILIANGIGFLLNRNWTFRSRSVSVWGEIVRYYTVNLGGFALNLLLMALAVDGLHVPYLLASALIAIGMTGVNFFLHRNWSFSRR